MKTFATAVLAGCLIIVIALQVLMLRNQNHQDSESRYQSINQAYPHIELASYSVEAVPDEVEASADPEEIEFEPDFVEGPSEPMFEANPFGEPVIVTPLSTAAGLPPTLVPAESESVLSLLDAEAELATPFGPAYSEKTKPLSADISIPPATKTGPVKAPPAVAPSDEVAGATVEQEPPATEKYPMWLLLKPDGVQFLQSDEELATNLSSIPANAFLVGCFEPKFEGVVANEKPDFQLTCQEFMLKGRYGTPQTVLIKGAELRYSTLTRKIELKGSDEIELTCKIENGQMDSHLLADEITFQLHDDSFQVSVKGSTSLEIDAYPAPVTKPRSSDSRGFDPFPDLRQAQ